MDVYIHIGYPKTGSTAIQSHVFTNHRWLMNKGLYIPKAGYGGGFGHVHMIPTSFVPPVNFGEKKGPTELEKLVAELKDAEQSGFKKCLITWEGFTDKREHELQPFGEALREHRVIVLAYVREHGDLYQSTVLQDLEQLRFGRGKGVFDRTNMFEQMGPKFDYAALFTMWEEAFGANVEIKTRLFDRSRLLQNNVVIDFLQWVGLDVDQNFCLQTKSVNPSLDCRSGAFLVMADAGGADPHTLRNVVSALLAVIAEDGPQSRQFLEETEREEIRTFYGESTRKLFTEFRPENASESENDFVVAQRPKVEKESEPTEAWLSRVYTAMANPQVPLWQGNVLVSMNLARIAGSPSKGWRGPEQDGIWSVGYQSEIRFRLPEVDSEQGPKAIKLTLAGHYYGENNSTVIRSGGQECVAELLSYEQRIEIDSEVREKGVTVVLEHEKPTITEEGKGDPAVDGIAFKIQFMSFDFIWE